jgi:predicted RND superfamily exporter protein
MIKATAKFQKQQTRVLKQIRKMREEMEDLHDYLDLLEARAVNDGKATYTASEVKARLGLK